MIGSLFIRTYERGSGLSGDACCGIKGYHQLKKIPPQGGKQDILALTLTVILRYWGR